LPSAGETMARGSDGISRFGLRKKNATKAANSRTKKAAGYSPSAKASAAKMKIGIRNLNASLTIINTILGGKPSRMSRIARSGLWHPRNPWRQLANCVDDSVGFEIWRSLHSSGLSDEASSSSAGLPRGDRFRTDGDDCAAPRVG